MMLPLFCLYIWRSAARVVRNAPSRWIASSRFHLANSKSTIGATIWMPALLTSTSSAPKVCDHLGGSGFHLLLIGDVHGDADGALAGRIDLARGGIGCFASRSAMATLAPSRANMTAISLPMPLAAPVMMATLSFKRMKALQTHKVQETVLWS